MAAQISPRKQTQSSLLWLEGTCADRITPLSESVVIGRDASACDVLLDDDATSRRHARIMTDPEGQAFLTDLGSSNGTFVNGNPVTRTLLADGDKLSFGSRHEVHCIFRALSVPREEAAAAAQVEASEAATAALSAGLSRPNERGDAGAGGSAARCSACGAAARDWGDFCHRCGARLLRR